MKKKAILYPVLLCAAGISSGVTAAPVQWADNGHWYEYVNTQVDWDTARSNALASSYNGLSGYLVTITSAEEQDFLMSVFGSILAWAGGSDEWDSSSENDEGSWKWMDGPEAGQTFWDDNGTYVTYANWSPNEPNNCCGGEDYLVYGWNNGRWNDHGGPGNAYYQVGYIVEYGANTPNVPEPALSLLLGGALGALGWYRRRRP